MTFTKNEQTLYDNLSDTISDWLADTDGQQDAVVVIFKYMTKI